MQLESITKKKSNPNLVLPFPRKNNNPIKGEGKRPKKYPKNNKKSFVFSRKKKYIEIPISENERKITEKRSKKKRKLRDFIDSQKRKERKKISHVHGKRRKKKEKKKAKLTLIVLSVKK